MVPKLHKKGRSFRGAAMYLLHDKDRATTSERVAWTETRNLATRDGHVAWRVMAATALSADHLKRNAGVKNTGRKSKGAVLHLTLSWHPEEKEGLSKDEMMRAAHGAIRALGAEDRQVLLVAHNDEPQPHMHLLINRVSPEDGRMLSSSKEKLALSRWAQRYEQERGAVLCEQRVINNKARERGEYVRGERDTPRHIYERQAANHDAELHRAQRAKDRAVGAAQRAIRNRQEKGWAKLIGDHKAALAAIRAAGRKRTAIANDRVLESYRPAWASLHHEQQLELRAFERDERSVLGRMKNRVRSIDLGELIRGPSKGEALSGMFGALASSGARLERLKYQHDRREASLRAEQRVGQRKAARAVRTEVNAELQGERNRFQAARAELVLGHSIEQAKMRAEWRTRRNEREKVYAQSLDPNQPRETFPHTDREAGREAGEATEEFNRAAELGHDSSSDTGGRRPISDVFREIRERQDRERSRDLGDHER